MKKTILILLVTNLFCSDTYNPVAAQAYRPMAIDGAHWIIVLNDHAR